jgi:hypothetical protein
VPWSRSFVHRALHLDHDPGPNPWKTSPRERKKTINPQILDTGGPTTDKGALDSMPPGTHDLNPDTNGTRSGDSCIVMTLA